SMAAYLNVPVYAAFHDWLGRRDVLGPMWDAWAAGDRKKALEVIPEEALRDILIIGSPGKCRERIQEYIEAGVHTPAIQIMHPGDDLRETIRALAP
ncbi:MAG: LLM class flavin-dependent oxidoreductase, partial [Acidobacteriota bacterium]|nr:LLM class flavin-dependent oxidoreductase [Acidobacteriota bacterium]